MMKKSIVIIAAIVMTVTFAASANAVVIEWELTDFQFDDGGTAYGTFIFDTETDQFLDIDIYTTAGTNVDGRHYMYTAGAWGDMPDIGILAFSDASGPYNYLGAGWFRIDADIDYEAQVGDVVLARR